MKKIVPPEIGVGAYAPVAVPVPRHVLAHRFTAPGGVLLLLHNLRDEPVTLDLGRQPDQEEPVEVFADDAYEPPGDELSGLALNGYGYRWIRLRRTAGG